MDSKAEAIAKIIRETNTDFRGDLLMAVSIHLLSHAQGFTAHVLANAAREYGLSDKSKGTKL